MEEDSESPHRQSGLKQCHFSPLFLGTSMEDQWAGEGTSSGESRMQLKKQISAKLDTGITEREHKAYLGFGFFMLCFSG